MAWTQDDIDELKAAISSGQTLMRSGDRETQYRSLAEMRSILAEMENEVNGRSKGLRLGRHKAGFMRD